MLEKFNNFSSNLKEVVGWLQKEMKQISAGQANASVLDSVYVESYGTRMAVMHVATISLDGNSLKVVPFDKSQVKAIEQAIRDADLGLSIVTESDGLRVVFPQLTTETRAKYVKLAKEKFEDARIKVRQERGEVMDELDKAKKEGELTEDDAAKKKTTAQDMVDKTNLELQQIFNTKEEAILKV